MQNEKLLVKFLKRDSFEMLMFGWVTGVLFNIPSCSIEQAIKSFYGYYNVDEVLDGVPSIEGMKVTYHRMKKEYFEMQRNGV